MKKINDYIYVTNKAEAITKSIFKGLKVGTRYCILGKTILVYQFPNLITVELEHMAKGLGVDLITAQKILSKQIIQEKKTETDVIEEIKETKKVEAETILTTDVEDRIEEVKTKVEDSVEEIKSEIEEKIEESKLEVEKTNETLEENQEKTDIDLFNVSKEKYDELFDEFKKKELEVQEIQTKLFESEDKQIALREEIESLKSVIDLQEKRIQVLEEQISKFDVINPEQ